MQSRSRSDPGFGFGPPRYPGTFLLAFRQALAGLHWQARRWLGHAVTVELHVTVAGALTVIQGHAIGEEVRAELLEHIPRLTDVIVHADPEEAFPNEHHPGRNHQHDEHDESDEHSHTHSH